MMFRNQRQLVPPITGILDYTLQEAWSQTTFFSLEFKGRKRVWTARIFNYSLTSAAVKLKKYCNTSFEGSLKNIIHRTSSPVTSSSFIASGRTPPKCNGGCINVPSHLHNSDSEILQIYLDAGLNEGCAKIRFYRSVVNRNFLRSEIRVHTYVDILK